MTAQILTRELVEGFREFVSRRWQQTFIDQSKNYASLKICIPAEFKVTGEWSGRDVARS